MTKDGQEVKLPPEGPGGALNKGCEGALGLCRTFQVAENAKKPRLAYFAKRMTSVGHTSLTWANDIEEKVETQLIKIRKRVKHLGGMLKKSEPSTAA